MTHNRITVNGQQYDSPDAMPPEVRRLYEEAMRMAGPSLASGQDGGTAQIFAGLPGQRLGASVVVNRIITVNGATYGSADELPPNVRRLYEEALKGATPPGSRPKSGLHVSVKLAGPQASLDESGGPATPLPLPIEPSSESALRGLPMSLAITVVIGLILWGLLGC